MTLRSRLYAVALALLLATLLRFPASAALTEEQLASVGVNPPPGASVPLDAPLTDLDGRTTTPRRVLGDRPAVIVFADYRCTQLCSPILAVAGDALSKSGLAGLHFWWPKITGRLYPEAWARFAAILMFFGFNFTFSPQFILGYLGMPRRYHSYPPEFQPWNVMSSTGAVVLAAAYLMPLAYLTWSCVYGKTSPADPWHAKGLEWRTSSPPPKHNFARTPIVTDEPYDYHDPETGPEPQARPVDTARAPLRFASNEGGGHG